MTNLRLVELLDHRLVVREALDVLDDLLVLLDREGLGLLLVLEQLRVEGASA